MRVVLSSQANADLARIAGFIAQDNTPRAASFVAELRDVAARLAVGGYCVTQDRKYLPMTAGCYSEQSPGIYWHGPC